MKAQLASHKISLKDLPAGTAVADNNNANAPFKVAAPTGDPKTWVATLGVEKSIDRALKAKGNAERGKVLPPKPVSPATPLPTAKHPRARTSSTSETL